MTSLLTLLLLVNVSAWRDDAPASPPNANAPAQVQEPAPPEAEPIDDVDPQVDALLRKLESAVADLHDFQANLRYDKWDPVTNRWEIRAGELLYEVKPDGNKRFAMNFDTLIVGNRKQDRVRRFIFDNGWLAEINFEDKQFIKRQIVPPGKEFDPFKLGDGPFPLPIGQSRSDVLARFDVSPLARPEDERLADLVDVEGLRLVPKPNAPEAESFERIDVFYDKTTVLPVGIFIIELGATKNPSVDLREKKVVRLRDVKRNQGIDPAKLDIRNPDPKEWSISIEPWHADG